MLLLVLAFLKMVDKNSFTFLFIPVSSTEGIGEYARSLIIAQQVQLTWPTASIYFVLNEAVAYRHTCPFQVFTTRGSATKDSGKVLEVLTQLKPDFVLFDAAGRAVHFKKAQELGAKVGFIAQHKKKRSRGLKLNRITSIDLHWVAQPDFTMEKLGAFERFKLTLFSKPAPKNIGAVFKPIAENEHQQILQRYGLEKEFFIFNAGSGGHRQGQTYSIELFYQAAKVLSEQTGLQSVVIVGDNYPGDLPSTKAVLCIKSLDNQTFIQLLIAAKGRMISAGDTLLQCITLSLPCVAAAVSKDQPPRLKTCHELALVLPVKLTQQDIVLQCLQLLREDNRASLIKNMRALQCTNALDIIIEDIVQLLEENT